jgi:hypothetical protein
MPQTKKVNKEQSIKKNRSRSSQLEILFSFSYRPL